MIAVHQPVANADLVHLASQQVAGIQIHELADDVGPGQVNVVLPLAIRQAGVQITGLGIDQEGRESIGITQEKHVGQGDIAPVEPGKMEPYQKDRQGIDQPLCCIRAQIAGEEGTVGQ